MLIRRKEIRMHKVLSNGQVASFYALRIEHRDNTSSWDIGFRIGTCIKANNYWMHKITKGNSVLSTGSCGIEGMMYAAQCLTNLEDMLYVDDCIVVRWLDSKRKRAYAYIQRLGYEQGTFRDEPCYYKKLT
jgi:hypothetical protein